MHICKFYFIYIYIVIILLYVLLPRNVGAVDLESAQNIRVYRINIIHDIYLYLFHGRKNNLARLLIKNESHLSYLSLEIRPAQFTTKLKLLLQDETSPEEQVQPGQKEACARGMDGWIAGYGTVRTAIEKAETAVAVYLRGEQ